LNKAIVTTIGLAGLNQWVTPLVNVIAIPAHAQTSANTAPSITLSNTAPELFVLVISDDKNNFDYSVDFFDTEIGGIAVIPPTFNRTVAGNSGSDTSLTINFTVSSLNGQEIRVAVIDSNAEQVNETLSAVTP
jgi:hypothetical protein